ncbi:polysaccharide deacetylase family protein [Undibacterium sp. CCC3.4]|uniref:polysaccharide deacetylase family protein n=1 Tax=unclassified Undibacterium TaxID=2630295 RepID=UPI003A0FD44E
MESILPIAHPICNSWRGILAAALALYCAGTQAAACSARIYLTFDTGSQSQAELVATTLRRHNIHATFFLANEKTVRQDYSLDPSWSTYWSALAKDGHAFGSHSFDHVYLLGDLADGKMLVKPQFGAAAGKKLSWTPAQYCSELRRVDQRFMALTGQALDPFWRAPGGKVTPNALKAAAACGYQHVGWAAAGFSGDELPGDRFSNRQLLQRALDNLRDGDIFMAHLGIWSRTPAWMPENLEPLIRGLEQKGFCFATLREHPAYRGKPL